MQPLVLRIGGTKMKCCICGQEIVDGFGNNPWPVKDKGECCDLCNISVVLKARLNMLNNKKKGEKQNGKKR